MYLSELCCCGVQEISDLQDVLGADNFGFAALKRLFGGEGWYYAPQKYNADKHTYEDSGQKKFVPGCAHIIFTDAHDRDELYGKPLAKYIHKEGLGRVIASRATRNPNSGNYVTTFVWTLNQKGCEAWCKKHLSE